MGNTGLHTEELAIDGNKILKWLLLKEFVVLNWTDLY
jgi:hypothetical protein